MEQNVLHKAPVEEYIAMSMVAVSVNVDQHADLQRRFNINRWPCDFVLDPSGSRRLVTSTGPRSVADYCQMLEKSVAWNTQLQARQPKPAPMTEVAKTPAPQTPAPQTPAPQTPAPQTPAPAKFSRDQLMIDGFSPVSLLKEKKWLKGTEEFAVQHEGQWYLLLSADEVKTFQAKPENYIPQFMGCDPVLLWESSQVPAARGMTKFAAFYDDQLYLFATKENRDRFKEAPDRYISTRVVLDLDLIETVTR
jgi:YHS domain-containing protein